MCELLAHRVVKKKLAPPLHQISGSFLKLNLKYIYNQSNCYQECFRS